MISQLGSAYVGIRILGLLGFAFVSLCPAPCARGEYPTPGNPKSVAGRPILSVPADPFMTASQEQRIVEALRRPARIQWQATSPVHLAKELSAYFPSEVNRRALEDMGLSVDMELNLQNVDATTPLGSNLIQILETNDLTIEIRGGKLSITTQEDAGDEGRLPVRIYDVTPLTVIDRADQKVVSFNALLNTLQSTIDPSNWESMGGMSTMYPTIIRDRALLSISAPTMTHLKIQAYLDQANSGPDVAADQWLKSSANSPQNNNIYYDQSAGFH